MPTYAYRCNKCKIEFDIIKSYKDIDFIEVCEECGFPGERVIRFSGHIAPDNVAAYYNNGLGKVVRSRADIRQELARVKGETGREFIEVGNEVIKKTKPKKSELIDDQVRYDFKKALSGNSKR